MILWFVSVWSALSSEQGCDEMQNRLLVTIFHDAPRAFLPLRLSFIYLTTTSLLSQISMPRMAKSADNRIALLLNHVWFSLVCHGTIGEFIPNIMTSRLFIWLIFIAIGEEIVSHFIWLQFFFRLWYRRQQEHFAPPLPSNQPTKGNILADYRPWLVVPGVSFDVFYNAFAVQRWRRCTFSSPGLASVYPGWCM